MTKAEIILNVTVLSLVIKVDALITTLSAEQKLSYKAEVQIQKDGKFNSFLAQYDLTPEQKKVFRTLFEETLF